MIHDPQLDRIGPDAQGRPRWNGTPALLALHPELSACRVFPATLERVWAGDDPAAPTLTVALRFPDAETEAVALAAFDN